MSDSPATQGNLEALGDRIERSLAREVDRLYKRMDDDKADNSARFGRIEDDVEILQKADAKRAGENRANRNWLRGIGAAVLAIVGWIVQGVVNGRHL